MKYVDVILPLPLEGFFTYSIPPSLDDGIVIGARLLVPFGKSKSYVALAVNKHDNKPDFKCKDIISILDKAPVVTSMQLDLWRWISEYYMSPIGEVYNAALPSGLKAQDGYKPKTELCVSLPQGFDNDRSISVMLEMLNNARKQKEVFTEYLRMSGYIKSGRECTTGILGIPKKDSKENETTTAEITRDELMNTTGCTAAVIKSLTDRKFLVTYEREVGRLNKPCDPHPENIKPLNMAQQDAYNNILMAFMQKNVVLLHGVTSSGKTEIYIHLIEQALRKKQQVLYLLPEIALTVQIRDRLQRVFGSRLGIYHSKYSDAERVEIWKKQLSDEPYDVILGARSAVLLPFTRLGLVIIDEEHETSFKQQEPAPRYHARSTAIILARMHGAKTLLGTATPSAESYHNALTGKYGMVTLTQRYKDIQLPEIEVVDTHDLQRRKMMCGPFSPQLLTNVRKALSAGEQVILFQNRRGFAPMIECRTCGWVPRCNNCDVSLTYHKNMGQLTCHYCGHTYQVPQACPNCEGTELRGRGYGTEKIEDYVAEIFPEARVARMDLDTTRTRSAYERIINDFSSGRTNLLIGTQMISKGLDFDRVSVVGILNADSMLNIPDFRAYEHAFMMMSQVAGRAGRKGRRGLVILQTKNPQLPVITQTVNNNYQAFYKELFEERAAFRYPPFYRLIYAYIRHRDESVAESAAYDMGYRLRQLFGERVLGPDKPAVARIKTMSIRKIVLKLENGIDITRVRECLRAVEKACSANPRHKSVQIYYDVDPE